MIKKLLANTDKIIYNFWIVFIGLYFAMTPFDYIRDIGYFSHATKIAMIGILLFFLINVVKYHKKVLNFGEKKNKKIAIILIIFYLYMMLTTIESKVDIEKTIGTLSIFTQSFLFVFIILILNINKNDMNKIENIWFAFSSIFSLTITFFNFHNPERVALIFFCGLIDPNFYCATLIAPFLIGIDRFIKKDKKWKPIIAILDINMLFSFLLAGSRGSLIAIVLSVFIYFFFYYRKQQKLSRLLGLLLIIVMIISAFLPFIPSETLNRFSIQNIIKSGGSGRTAIWENAINYFINSNTWNKIFGNGIGTFRYTAGEEAIITGYVAKNVYSHNIFFTLLIEGGIVGIIIAFILLKNILTESYKIDNKIPFCTIIALVVAGMFIDSLYIRLFWAIVSYVLIYIKIYQLGEKDE